MTALRIPRAARLLLVLLASISGCARWSAPPANYETVPASPLRHTTQADKLHAKALEVIRRTDDPNCFQCTCVGKKLCNLHKAEALVQEALVADVRHGPAHNTLGLLYFRQRKMYLAAWEFEYASQIMPSRPEPLNNLGLVYEEAGRLGQAIECYQQALELAPTEGEYLANLARVQLKDGAELDEVRGLLSEVVFRDTRPEFVEWARDLLGGNPPTPADDTTSTFNPNASDSVPDGNTSDKAESIPPPPAEADELLKLQPPTGEFVP